MTAEHDRGNSVGEVMNRLPPADREKFAEFLRQPGNYFAADLSEVLAILEGLPKKLDSGGGM